MHLPSSNLRKSNAKDKFAACIEETAVSYSEINSIYSIWNLVEPIQACRLARHWRLARNMDHDFPEIAKISGNAELLSGLFAGQLLFARHVMPEASADGFQQGDGPFRGRRSIPVPGFHFAFHVGRDIDNFDGLGNAEHGFLDQAVDQAFDEQHGGPTVRVKIQHGRGHGTVIVQGITGHKATPVRRRRNVPQPPEPVMRADDDVSIADFQRRFTTEINIRQ